MWCFAFVLYQQQAGVGVVECRGKAHWCSAACELAAAAAARGVVLASDAAVTVYSRR
jgi:hypothetical protein